MRFIVALDMSRVSDKSAEPSVPDAALRMCHMTHTGSVSAMERGFLGELDASAREALGGLGRHRRFDAGSSLFLEGDLGGNVMVIHTGHVKVFATSHDAHGVLLAVRGPGDVLGDLSAIDNEPRSASGTALDDVDAQVIAAREFRVFLRNTPGAGLALLRVIIARQRDSDRMRVEFGARDTSGRVALRLLELAESAGEAAPNGIRIALPLTQDDLAGWVAASREAVARALASLRRRGLIVTGRREITIVDLEALRRAARS
jgi:CRP-like cAMP-binding protein